MDTCTHQSDKAAELKSVLAVLMVELTRSDTSDMLRLLKREDLSMPRIAALSFVERHGAVSISQISTWLGLSLANTSMLVDKLVCQGLVTRAEDVNDRRHKRVELAEKGQTLVRELQATRVDAVVQRLLRLPPALLDRALDVLREMTTHLPLISANLSADAADELKVRI